MGVLVVITSCGSTRNLQLEDDEYLPYFLKRNFCKIRDLLIGLVETRLLDWTQEMLMSNLDVSIPSLDIHYTVPEQSNASHALQLLQAPQQQQRKVLDEPQQRNGIPSTGQNHTENDQSNSIQPLEELQLPYAIQAPAAQHHTENDENRQFHWSTNATKCLISLYKENKENFSNRSIKKDRIWREITSKLHENGFRMTQKQVEDKFKNLRRSYAKVKDAMGPNSSGAPAPEKFAFFDEMEEIFAHNASYSPPLLVGSRRAVAERDSEPPNSQEVQQPAKKSNLMTLLQAQEKRHKEILEELKKSRELLQEKLDKLIDKL